MSASPFDFKESAPLRIGVLLRQEYLKSRMSIMDGVLSYSLENSGLRAYLIPLRGGEIPSNEILSKVDGLITWAASSDCWMEEMWSSGVPLVNCNSALANLVPTVSAGNLHEVAYNYLKSLGRRTIGYVTTSPLAGEWPAALAHFTNDSGSMEFDLRIFTKVSKDPGQYPEHMLSGDGEEELEKFLVDLPKPAALWCVHDEMAALVWRKASELGIDVPGQIALVGFGDHPCAVHGTPGITTIRIPGSRLGHEAARHLHRQLLGLEKMTTSLVTIPQLADDVIERLSTGGSNPINRGIQRAWRLLEDYPEEGLTVEHLIEESRISRVGFYKQFEKAFNISPGKAIRNSRTKKAREYLLSTDLPIYLVGRRCGFSGEGEFSNFFKRETGKTPKEWRNGHLFASMC
jgi:DNA-binding LacI/PurR family transcriptional regulator